VPISRRHVDAVKILVFKVVDVATPASRPKELAERFLLEDAHILVHFDRWRVSRLLSPAIITSTIAMCWLIRGAIIDLMWD
jgi:hypothetical protein